MRAVALFACIAVASGVPAAFGQEAGDVEAGHAFARSLCAACHAVEAGAAQSPNPGAPTFTRIAAEPGMTGTALSVILRNPHLEMPDIILSAKERSDVIAYMLTLKTDD